LSSTLRGPAQSAPHRPARHTPRIVAAVAWVGEVVELALSAAGLLLRLPIRALGGRSAFV
jgi:hypothetical protein